MANGFEFVQATKIDHIAGIGIEPTTAVGAAVTNFLDDHGMPLRLMDSDGYFSRVSSLGENYFAFATNSIHNRSLTILERPDMAHTGTSIKGPMIRPNKNIVWSGDRLAPCPEGRMNLAYMPRMVSASKYLGEIGLKTEEPDALYAFDKLVPVVIDKQIEIIPIAEYRETIVAEARKVLAKKPLHARFGYRSELETFTPAVLVRSMPETCRRLGELPSRKYLEGLGIIKSNKTASMDYLTAKLPKSMAEVLATMHANEVAHGYPTEINWLMKPFPSLVDLDSVSGRPLGLGDSVISPKHVERDLRVTGIALTETIQNFIETSWNLTGNDRDTEQYAEVTTKAYAMFYMHYLNTRIQNKTLLNNEDLSYYFKKFLFMKDANDLCYLPMILFKHLIDSSPPDDKDLVINTISAHLDNTLAKIFTETLGADTGF